MRFILLGRPEPARGQTGVVERYFGRAIAQQTADYMEYEGAGWKQD